MDRKKVRRRIYWGLFILFIIGSMIAGSPFQLIDILIVRPIVNIVFLIFNLVHDFGLAIIILTILVKLCMLPLALKQMNQMKLIRKIQPELVKIKENCKGNKQLESMQTMDLYRRYNVKPFSSIVTLIIQLPIFLAIFSAITVIATPRPADNLMNRAYDVVAYEGSEIANLEEKQQTYLADLSNNEIPAEEKTAYDFHPMLFGAIDLNVTASALLMGDFSWSAVFILACAILASVVQYLVSKQQMPSDKSGKSKSFRDLINDAKEGRELDETDISNMTTRQMSKIMPIMMFLLMFNFNGALVFYYFLSNLFTAIQQWFILKKVNAEIDEVTDKAVLKELRNIKEAEVIENKKTGTKIRTLSAKDIKEGETVKKGGTKRKTGSKATGKTAAKKGGAHSSKKKGA